MRGIDTDDDGSVSSGEEMGGTAFALILVGAVVAYYTYEPGSFWVRWGLLDNSPNWLVHSIACWVGVFVLYIVATEALVLLGAVVKVVVQAVVGLAVIVVVVIAALAAGTRTSPRAPAPRWQQNIWQTISGTWLAGTHLAAERRAAEVHAAEAAEAAEAARAYKMHASSCGIKLGGFCDCGGLRGYGAPRGGRAWGNGFGGQ
jgi:hypothetical protein